MTFFNMYWNEGMGMWKKAEVIQMQKMGRIEAERKLQAIPSYMDGEKVYNECERMNVDIRKQFIRVKRAPWCNVWDAGVKIVIYEISE